jgi:type IV pilus assembly protein PilV
MRNSRTRSSGMTFTEILFSILILAVGILGVSGLQALSLQQNRSAHFRADALQLGNDILDRIRANPSSTYAPITLVAEPDADKNCVNVECNPVEMAEYDIAQWKCSLNSDDDVGDPFTLCQSYGIRGSIPKGAGSITLTDEVYEVTVQWEDDRKGTIAFIRLRTQVD